VGEGAILSGVVIGYTSYENVGEEKRRNSEKTNRLHGRGPSSLYPGDQGRGNFSGMKRGWDEGKYAVLIRKTTTVKEIVRKE